MAKPKKSPADKRTSAFIKEYRKKYPRNIFMQTKKQRERSMVSLGREFRTASRSRTGERSFRFRLGLGNKRRKK